MRVEARAFWELYFLKKQINYCTGSVGVPVGVTHPSQKIFDVLYFEIQDDPFVQYHSALRCCRLK